MKRIGKYLIWAVAIFCVMAPVDNPRGDDNPTGAEEGEIRYYPDSSYDNDSYIRTALNNGYEAGRRIHVTKAGGESIRRGGSSITITESGPLDDENVFIINRVAGERFERYLRDADGEDYREAKIEYYVVN